MLLHDRQVKMHETGEAICISKERIGNILHEELGEKFLCKTGTTFDDNKCI